jgi:hypothetical protein
MYERFVLARMLTGLAESLAASGQIAEANSVAEEATRIQRQLRVPLAS